MCIHQCILFLFSWDGLPSCAIMMACITCSTCMIVFWEATLDSPDRYELFPPWFHCIFWLLPSLQHHSWNNLFTCYSPLPVMVSFRPGILLVYLLTYSAKTSTWHVMCLNEYLLYEWMNEWIEEWKIKQDIILASQELMIKPENTYNTYK